MGMFDKIKSKAKGLLRPLIRAEVEKALRDFSPLIPQIVDFHNSGPEGKQSFHDHTKRPLESYEYYCGLRDRLKAAGVEVEDLKVDVGKFEAWMDEFPQFREMYRDSGEAAIEKCLEHYLSYTRLGMTSEDVFIDIAAYSSPFGDMLNKRGIESYRLDMSYPEGVHGRNIGADAGNTMLPDNFASALAAHCAYECFMGDADVRFVKEASRILRKGGRYVIVPLYIDDTYFIATSPYCDQTKVEIDDGALKVWRDDVFPMPFSRHYSPESLYKRIYSAIPGDMTGKIYFLSNLPELMERFKGQSVYCYFMFYCEKKTS